MARTRRGSFGLQPRVVANVTSQIVALAREYVAKRDALIMDAWRNGGTFEGKKATDEMVLSYWDERSKDLSPDDPDYEQAKDQIMQLQYGIAQSKADVLHVQGKLSDTAYAQFFLKWAQKVPHNSEFYRTLQKDAAQLIESAKAKGRANSERAKTESFNKFVTETNKDHIAIGDAMTAALTDLSKATGLSITGNGDELLSLLTTNVKANPDEYRRLLDTIKAGDPSWDGQLTEGYFTQHIKDAVEGYNLIADRAQAGGYVSAYASATQGMAAMSSWGQNTKVWPVAETYSNAMSILGKVLNDPNASQMDKMSAAEAASASLTAMANTPGIDVASKTMIEADAQRLLGQDAGDNPSFGASMLGRDSVTPQIAMQLGAWEQTKAEMAANPTAYAYAPVDKNGQFDATGQGPLGIVPAGQVQPGAQGVMVPGADGKAVLAMIMPHSVYVQDPNNPTASPKLAGYSITWNVGGKNMQLWGYKDDTGANHWSVVSPVAEGASTTTDSKGDIYVSPQPSPTTDPIARAKQIAATPGMEALGSQILAQLTAQQKAGSPLNASVSTNSLDKDGHNIGSLSLEYKNGTFVATQSQNTLDKDGHVVATSSTPIDIAVNSPQSAAFSQPRLAAGEIAGVTFDSPLGASVQAAGYTQTQEQVNRYASDPAFQQAFLSQTMQTLNVSDPYDPRIASAWRAATTGDPVERAPQIATNRADLSYPGSQPQSYEGKALGITFGHPELKLPSLPGVGGAQMRDTFDRGGSFAGVSPQVLPGLGAVPQTPTGSPAPTITPTPGPSPTTITPTPTPTPTALTPTATPMFQPAAAPVYSTAKTKALL